MTETTGFETAGVETTGVETARVETHRAATPRIVRVARTALLAAIPAELTVTVLLLAGVDVPAPLAALTAAAVAGAVALEVAVVLWLYRQARRGGSGRRSALLTVRDRLLPEVVARLIGFELKGMQSLGLWALRRRSGVPAGAVEVSYHREESFVVGLWTFAMVVETVMLEILLRGIGCPDWLRVPILALDVYGVVIVIAIRAACVTRPHVITPGELRVRYAAYFDLRIPRERITSVRLVRNRDEQGLVRVADGTAAVAVTSQTNIVVELDEPITVVRPLGKRAEARTIRFFADSPERALTSLNA